MGRITGIGKNTLRAILVEASCTLTRKDQARREKYDRIKIHAGGKRAIVAIARTLLLCMRRMLLDKQAYALPLAASTRLKETGLGHGDRYLCVQIKPQPRWQVCQPRLNTPD